MQDIQSTFKVKNMMYNVCVVQYDKHLTKGWELFSDLKNHQKNIILRIIWNKTKEILSVV